MGDTGQGTSNGGGGGTTRATPSNATVNISQMQALAQKSGTLADQELANMLTDATSKAKVKTDANQQDTDTQRFINATGIADRKPEVVKDEDALENKKFLGETIGPYLYHTDAPQGTVRDAKTFGDQYQTGRMYNSSGVHGDGTYFSDSSDGSWDYGYRNPNAYQIKGMLNSKAKVIKEADLKKRITSFKRTHPKAARVINNMSTGYGSQSGTYSVYAQLFGFNVISYQLSGWRKQTYYTITDRSATTVVKNGIHDPDQYTNKNWKFQ